MALKPESLKGPQLLGALQWRQAVKKFDPARRINDAAWQALEQSLVLAPSSYGLQPWKFVVVESPKIKEALLPFSYGQKQVVEASHLVVLAARRSIAVRDVDEVVERIAELRGPDDSLLKFRQRVIGDLVEGPRASQSGEWAAQQVYIALGQFLAAAALLGVDACPMGGFSAKDYDRVLDLESRGYRSVVLAAAGYRLEPGSGVELKKVRFRPERVLERIDEFSAEKF